MARSKSALVFLLLCIMVLILSPWADAPSSPTSFVDVVPEDKSLVTIEPIVAEEISSLVIEVALDEPAYRALTVQNDNFMLNHPNILVDLRRINPEQAYDTYKRSSVLEESADIMLLANEWIIEFASSGYLLPTEAAFVGKALAEQFDAVAAPLTWNSYKWGVPRDMDPYVLVWNMSRLHEWLGEDVTLPLTLEQWAAVSDRSAETQGAISWLSIDRNDPLALLAWLESATAERSDGIWSKDAEPWNGTLFEQAMLLLDLHKANVQFTATDIGTTPALKEGNILAAVMPYSRASALVAQPRLDPEPELEIDHQSWKLPYVWPRGTSFAVSSNTEAEEAAYVWISEMTDEQIQLQNMEERGKLPVYRSLYDSDRTLSNLIPGRTGQSFPSQSPIEFGPDLSAQLGQLQRMWTEFARGAMSIERWKEEWAKHN
ncbi:extracellular solute-binding protein [Cohnella herbarum]|uniref:Extracellular solute-binding protein n=1 Tax=Cohnella herbarum TaxID=2728023 RepID=A0A7Z2ZKX0_9BACL|nr:extracellular solute-binding protein [Cohnella herbarum]QJD83616.1 extracellular solute-binding protein [Cohnella herbarum]